MNRYAQRLALGISWFFATLSLVELLPHHQIATYLTSQLLGKDRTAGGWALFLAAIIIPLLLLWGGMIYLHLFVRDSESKKEGDNTTFFTLTGVVAALLILLPKLLLKEMWPWEFYFRLAAFAVAIYYLARPLFFQEKGDDLSYKGIFEWTALGVAWGAVTAVSVTLFFTLMKTGGEGTLRAFIYGAVSGSDTSKILYIYGAIALFTLALLISNRNIWSIFKKELKLFFSTPIAYAVIVLFTLLAGIFFYSGFERYKIFASMPPQYFQFYKQRYNISLHLNDIVFQQLFYVYGVILLFLAPIVTMRLISEEKKSRTYELLMTAPITSFEIVTSKYLAALFQLTFIVGLTFLYPLSIAAMKEGAIEWAPIFTGYLGMMLLAGAFAAIGLYFSSLSEEQIVAAALSFGTLMLLWIIQMLSSIVPVGWPRELVKYLAIFQHLQGFAQGVVKSTDVLYYLSLIFLTFFMAHRSVESQRWK